MPYVYYKAWNSDTAAPETGDVLNHTITLKVDGATVAGLTPAEDANGVYHVEPSDAQLPVGSQYVLYGTSSTGDVEIYGTTGWRAASDVTDDVTAIKAQTDQLDFTGAGDTLKAEATNMRGTDDALLAANYTAPDNADIGLIRKLVSNKVILHPNKTGWIQFLDDDDVTPLLDMEIAGNGTRTTETP